MVRLEPKFEDCASSQPELLVMPHMTCQLSCAHLNNPDTNIKDLQSDLPSALAYTVLQVVTKSGYRPIWGYYSLSNGRGFQREPLVFVFNFQVNLMSTRALCLMRTEFTLKHIAGPRALLLIPHVAVGYRPLPCEMKS